MPSQLVAIDTLEDGRRLLAQGFSSRAIFLKLARWAGERPRLAKAGVASLRSARAVARLSQPRWEGRKADERPDGSWRLRADAAIAMAKR
jgi:hypothetical protein